MKRDQNICKFVTVTENHGITPHHFVLEKIAANTEQVRVCPLHAVYLVTGGTGTLITETGRVELRAGNIFFTFKQIPFNICNNGQLKYMYISFDGNRSEELFARFGICTANCVFEGYEGLTAFWESSLAKASEKNLDLISESVLLYTLGEMAPCAVDAKRYLLGDIVNFIGENFKNSELNLSAVAAQFGYNDKYFSRMFKSGMGIAFSAYLTNLRLQHAVFLMEHHVTSVKNVALLSGYKDPLYFSNVFKAKIGLSPKEYVEKNKVTPRD